MALDFIARGMSSAESSRNCRLRILSTLSRSIESKRAGLPELAEMLPTISGPSVTSMIQNSAFHSALLEPEQFHLTGGTWAQSGTLYPKNQFISPTSVHSGVSGNPASDAVQGQGQRVRFLSSSPLIEIQVLYGDTFGGFRLKVDGAYVKAGLLGNSSDGTPVGAPRTIGITWGDGSAAQRKSRLYELEWSSNGSFGGIYTPQEYSVQAAGSQNDLRILIHGDSMLSTIVDTANFSTALHPPQGTILGNLLGQADCWTSGVGGTGWINDNGGNKTTFGERQALDVLAPAPDVIVELGGRNDAGLVSQVEIETEVRTWIANILLQKPQTIIFMTGPILSRGGLENGAAANIAVRDAKRDAAANFPRNVAFIDNLQRKWSTGSGTQGGPLGDGNADWCTGADGAHFTQDGHVYFASLLSNEIARAIAPLCVRQHS